MKFLTYPYRLLRWMMLARPVRFTRFGTFYILFSIGIGAAAINTGNNLLYLILGILLGFIVISGFLSDSGLWGIWTEWVPIGSLYAQETSIMECRLHKGWFPGVMVEVESRWKGLQSVRSLVPWVGAKSSTSFRVTLTPQRRGFLKLESCLYATRFPFGLFQKTHLHGMEDRWIVFPRTRRLSWDLLNPRGENASWQPSQRQGLGASPFILRDYRPGDPLRQMDWKATAKRQELIVKEMEEEANEGDLFYIDAWPTQLSSEALEDFISFVASAIFTAYENGRPVGLATPDRFFKPEVSRQHVHRILEYLALVEPSRSSVSRRPTSDLGHRTTDVVALWNSYGH